MNIKLSFRDRKEIDTIIAGFTEEDHERIYREVEDSVNRQMSSPFTPVIRSFCHDVEAFDLAADTTDFQERMHNALWDSFTDYHRFQYALEIFKARHSFGEVA